MLAAEKLRRVEVRRDSGWEAVLDLGQLEPGDVFRMFEPDGTRVFDAGGFSAWVVEERPFIRCKPEMAEAHMMSPVQDGGR